MSIPTSLRPRLYALALALLAVFTLLGVTSQVNPKVASAQGFGDCSYLGPNYYWNGTTCVYSPLGSSSNCAYLGSNYYWNGSTCVNQTFGTNTSCTFLGSNYYWNGTSCALLNSGNCSYLGSNYFWNGSSCVYQPFSTGTSCAYLGSNYYWNGTSCVLLTSGNCSYLGSNYYWNGSSCVYQPFGTTTNCAYLGPNYYWNGSTCVYSGTTPFVTGSTTVTYQPGWNIVGGPAGTVLTGTNSGLFAWPPGATSYQALPAGTPLQAGQGYWAYFNTATTVTLSAITSDSVTVSLPAGQWVLIGNPGAGTATVTGASVTLWLYSPLAGSYSPTTTIPQGQGAWAFSSTGGTVTISSGVAGGPPPPP
jgi:hypothetical protein